MKSSLPQCLHSKSSSLGCVDLAAKSREYPIIQTNSGWTLKYALGINDKGQIVGIGINSSGQTHAFLLDPLPNGSVQAASTVQTNLPTYGICPAPTNGQDSLIFITHRSEEHTSELQ